ncbi:MAG: hypothetical protein WCE87_12825 [Candidatus Udaeobacter sp.]
MKRDSTNAPAPNRSRHRLACFRVPAALIPAQDFDYRLMSFAYSPGRLSWQPTWPSSQLQVGRGVPAKGLVFSSLSLQRPTCARRLFAGKTKTERPGEQHEQPISSRLSSPLLIQSSEVFVLAWPAFFDLPADISQGAGFFSLNS